MLYLMVRSEGVGRSSIHALPYGEEWAGVSIHALPYGEV